MWVQQVVDRLQSRGGSHEDLVAVVARVEDTCRDLPHGPQVEFGDPTAFADQIRLPVELTPAQQRRMIGPAGVMIIPICLVVLMIAAAFLAMFTAITFRNGDSGVTIVAGAPFAFLAVPAVVIILTRLPLSWLLDKVILLIIVVMLLMIAIIVVAVLWQTPVLVMSPMTAAVVTVVATVTCSAGFALFSLRALAREPSFISEHLMHLAVGNVLLVGFCVLLGLFG